MKPALIFEILAVILGFLFYKNYKNNDIKYFSYFLIYTIITEFIGIYMASVLHIKNHLPFNVYIVVSFLFYFILFYRIFKKSLPRKLIKLFVFSFVLFYLFELFVIKKSMTHQLLSYSFVVGAMFLVIILILFIIEIINNEKIIFNVKNSLIFWISIGLLLFHIGAIPIFIGKEFLNYNQLHFQILTFLNIVMYGCFSLGFILSDEKYNY